MSYTKINFKQTLTKINQLWSPKVVAAMNDYHFKLAKVEGDFVWHTHNDTDETFIVIEGQLTINFRDGSVDLSSGEMFVVPKGVEHKPVALQECQILLIEPKGVVNTGDQHGDLTAAIDDWI